jgi:hypothetical protein
MDLLNNNISSLTSSRGQNIEFINQAYRKPLQFFIFYVILRKNGKNRYYNVILRNFT